MSEKKINFLYKKFNRAPSTSTDISSNLLESFDVSGRRIVYNEEIYCSDIPNIIPNFNMIYSYISQTSVNLNNSGSSSSISMSGVSNSSLVSNYGLTEEIWQAFKDNKLLEVQSSNSN